MKINVLDKGYVKLLNHMGTDDDIANSARVSTQSNGKDNNRLIRYLIRKGHMQPIEFGVMKFEVKLPIFVERQWVRHRTATMCELSGRYTESDCEVYIPELDNVRGSYEFENDEGNVELFYMSNENAYSNSIVSYQDSLSIGVDRELARINLPLGLYTLKHWQIDLRNLLHFLNLRNNPHAQLEIKEYADAIEYIVADKFPLVYSAYCDYIKNAVTFSRTEMMLLRAYKFDMDKIIEDAPLTGNKWFYGKSELEDFLEKLK